jgi:hypothetical protein
MHQEVEVAVVNEFASACWSERDVFTLTSSARFDALVLLFCIFSNVFRRCRSSSPGRFSSHLEWLGAVGCGRVGKGMGGKCHFEHPKKRPRSPIGLAKVFAHVKKG